MDAGGPLEVVDDRRTGLVCEPRPLAVAEACAWSRDHADDARAWGQAGRRVAEQLTWDAPSTGCSHEGRLLLAAAAVAVGDRRLQRAAIAGASERVDVEIVRAGRLRRAPKADVAIYHVGNDPEAHGWIVEALRRRPGVVVLHELVLHHLVPGITLARGDAAGYLAAMEREYGLAGRLLAYGVLDNRIPPLWETRPQDFPLAGEILGLAQRPR